MRKPLVVLSSLLLLAAAGCSSDNSVAGPDGRCPRASVSAGQTVTGVLTADACTFNPDPDFSPFFDPFAFRIDSAQSYVVTLRGDVDAGAGVFNTALTLVAPSGTIAAEDFGTFEGLAENSQLAFVAPRSGSYSLRVHGYDASNFGPYALTVQACGAAPSVTTTAATGALAASDCVVHNYAAVTNNDSSLVDFYQLRLEYGQSVTVEAVSTAFKPLLQVGGPDFDAACQFDNCARKETTATTTDTARVTITAANPGVYTVTVGTDPRVNKFGTTGAYSVRIVQLP